MIGKVELIDLSSVYGFLVEAGAVESAEKIGAAAAASLGRSELTQRCDHFHFHEKLGPGEAADDHQSGRWQLFYRR